VPGKKRPVPTGGKPVTPDDGLEKQKVTPDSSVTDKQALFAANVFVSAYATAQIDKLVKLVLSRLADQQRDAERSRAATQLRRQSFAPLETGD